MQGSVCSDILHVSHVRFGQHCWVEFLSFWPYSDFPLLTHNGHNQGDSDHDFYPSPIAVMTASPGKSKMAARGSKKNFGSSSQLSLNKFFDLRIPSMRKVDDGGGKNEKKEKQYNVVYSGHPHCCQSTAQMPIKNTEYKTWSSVSNSTSVLPFIPYPLFLIP